jgi:hypothetical protein
MEQSPLQIKNMITERTTITDTHQYNDEIIGIFRA